MSRAASETLTILVRIATERHCIHIADYQAGSMSDVKVYVAKGGASMNVCNMRRLTITCPDVPDGKNILTAKHDAVARFIHVIQPLRTLYKLPPTSVHIFFDLHGETIAFNRNASIFLNLRYYEAWRTLLSHSYLGIC